MAYNLLRRLKLFEEKTATYVNYHCQKHQQVSNRMLEDVINTVKRLMKHKKKIKKINSLWKKVFLRRLLRTLTRAEKISEYFLEVDEDNENDNLKEEEQKEENIRLQRFVLEDLWQQHADECQYILHGRMPTSNSHIRSTFLQVKTFENKLEQRKKEYFVRINGRKKTLSELCEEHYLFLKEYVDKCISFHSNLSVPLSIRIEDVRQLLRQISAEECSFSALNLDTFIRDIEMPLRFACATLVNCDTSLKSNNENREVAYFLPSIDDRSLERGILLKNILSILQNYRWSVILGGPGSGKTTLLRWLTLEYAHFLRQGETEHFLLEERKEWELLATQIGLINCPILSVARVPILIRIGEFVTWLDSHVDCSLLDYIGQHTWYGNRYSETNDSKVLHEFIHHGHALILFDGLDKVLNYEQRKKVVNLIEIFLEKYVQTSSFISMKDDKNIVEKWGGYLDDYPEFLLERNQVIITSRIIGYGLVQIQSNLIAHFYLTSMNKQEVELFIRNWLVNVDNALINYISNENRFKFNREKLKKIREKLWKKAFCLATRSRLLSHPILLSVALSSLVHNDINQIDFTSEISVYDSTKKVMIESWISSNKTKLNAASIEWILRDLAVHLYENCPSGWIDKFDLIRLVFISLQAFQQQKHHVHMSNDKLNTQVGDFVNLLSSNVVGFATAQGLDAYGFLHRTLEEYFVALTIVNPLNCERILSAKMIADRLFICIWKTEYHKPLSLAIGWLDHHLKPDDMDVFCFELSNRNVGSLPLGCLLLTDALTSLYSFRSSSTIVRIFRCILMSSSLEDDSKEYLRQALNSLSIEAASSIFENLLHDDSIHVERMYELLLYCMEPIVDKSTWMFPSWLSDSTISFITICDEKDVNVHTIIDWIFRCVEPVLCHSHFNILESFLISEMISIDKIHPLILSVIIVLCGGMIKDENSIHFDPIRMHRLTPLAPLLIECCKKDIHDIHQNIRYLIDECETIIFEASIDDISRRTQDAYLALIILRSIIPINIFEHCRHHKVLSLVFYRLKLVLYHLRQFYTIQRTCSQNRTSLFSDISTFLNEMSTKYDINAKIKNSLTIAMIEACKHLTFPNTSSWKDIQLVVPYNNVDKKNEVFTIYSLRHLRHVLALSSTDEVTARNQWKYGKHSYQLLCQHPLFLVAFIPVSFQPIFERFILKDQLNLQNSEWNYIFKLVLLAEVLLFVDQQNMRTFELFSFLTTIEDTVQKNQLESYVLAIIQTVKATRYEYNLEDNEISIPTNVNLVTVRTAIEKEYERISSALSSVGHQQRLQVDLQLFSAALSIIRMCEFIREKKEIFEKVMQAVQYIQDHVLRILCLCHMRQIVCRWSDKTMHTVLQQMLIEIELEQLPCSLPLIIKSIILISCIQEGEKMHPLLNELLENVCTHLHQIPSDDEDAKDQESVFQALKTIVGLEIQLPFSFRTRSNLSDILEFNSSSLHSFLLQTDESFLTDFDNVLLCQLYLAELTVDTNTLMIVVPHLNDCIPTPKTLNLTEKLFEQWNWNCSTEKFSHHRIVSINMYLSSTPTRNIEQVIPFDDPIVYKDIEVRDRLMIENWLSYYDDKDNECHCQFALLAVGLLLRSDHENLSLSVIEKIFRILEKAFFQSVDNIRYQARTAFQSWYENDVYITCEKWSSWMWRVLRSAWLHSLSFPKIYIKFIDDINLLLELESNRLRLLPDDDERFSFLFLIGSYTQEVRNYLMTHIQTQLKSDSIVNDEYLATIIVHLAEVETDIDPELHNDNFVEVLKTIVYEQNLLPFTQRAASFALTFDKQGRTFLENTICFSQQNLRLDGDSIREPERIQLSDYVLYLCLWAFVDVFVNYRSVDESFFKSIEKLSSSVTVSQHALACYNYMLWKDKKPDESINDMEHRLSVSADFLYTVIKTKRECTIEREDHNDWCTQIVELLRSHWNDLADRFIDDCYNSLLSSSATMNRINRDADYLYVACELIELEPESFCEAVRTSVHGEEAFKKALYRAWKKGTIQQRRWCIELYSTFDVATVDWIHMIFTDFFDLYQNYDEIFKPLEKIENRDAIESLFPYLKSVSMGKRNIAVTFLVYYAITNSISCLEVYQLLDDVLKDPMSNKLFYDQKEKRSKPLIGQIQRLLLTITCLRQVSNKESLALLVHEKIIIDFYECLEASHYPLYKLR
ncbi:unnamed protein product [Rotaria sp. Silwood2]|nr:unnamed protein product [Rotaria sp. Silwood2]CAF3936990.1 unnamed protein product [Rotaria sp. Silwood2]